MNVLHSFAQSQVASFQLSSFQYKSLKKGIRLLLGFVALE
jgi:hypothetical protein